MTITPAMVTSAKWQFLTGFHTALHTYRIALFQNSVTLDATSTTYSTTNEVTGSGYTLGGNILTGYVSGTSGVTAYLNWTTNPTWSLSSFSAAGAVIYNTTGSSILGVYDFGQVYTVISSSFFLTFPANGVTAAVRIG
jgi:hypothetical protein